jgi:hypothetical protein
MREKIAGGATSFIFTVVVPLVVAGMIPHIDPNIGWPTVGVSIIVGIGFAIWGFSPHHLRDWRATLGPVALMFIGLAVYSGGALWYYLAHSPPAHAPNQTASAAPTRQPVATPSPDISPPTIAKTPSKVATRKAPLKTSDRLSRNTRRKLFDALLPLLDNPDNYGVVVAHLNGDAESQAIAQDFYNVLELRELQAGSPQDYPLPLFEPDQPRIAIGVQDKQNPPTYALKLQHALATVGIHAPFITAPPSFARSIVLFVRPELF